VKIVNVTPPETSRISRTSPALAAVLLACLSIGAFVATSLDDAFISFWPAYSLASWGKLVNYNGERLEQSSSLLHVVVLAAAYRVTSIPLPILAWIVSLASSIAACFVVHRLAAITFPRAAPYVPLLLASSPYFLYFSVNTLETTLALLCFAVFVLSCVSAFRGRASWSALLVSSLLFVTVRPEAYFVGIGPLIVLAVAGRKGWLVESRESSQRIGRTAAGIAALVTFLFVLLMAFRSAYFGSAFPQPVFAKMGGSWAVRMERGWAYLATYGDWLPLIGHTLGICTLAGMASAAWPRRGAGEEYAPRLMVSMSAFSFLAFVFFSGGDWMEAGRFLVPVLPLLILCCLALLERETTRGTGLIPWAAGFIFVFHVYGVLYFAHASTSTFRGRIAMNFESVERFYEQKLPETRKYTWVERTARGHLRDIPVCEVLDQVLPVIRKSGPVTVLSHQAGMIFFHLAQNPFRKVIVIDGAALSTRHLIDGFTSEELRAYRQANNVGIAVSFEDYFARAESLRDANRLPVPDIIFDFTLPYLPFVESLPARGYVLVFKGRGSIPGFRFEQDYGPVDMFVAVKRDLLPEGAVPLRLLDWNERPAGVGVPWWKTTRLAGSDVDVRLVEVDADHGREADGENWWYWTKKRIVFSFFIESPSLTPLQCRVRFQCLAASPRTTLVYRIVGEGLEVEDSIEMEVTGWSLIVSKPFALPRGKLEIQVSTESEPIRLGPNDPRLAAYRMKNVELIPADAAQDSR
jgi:hypothetical protein